MFTSRESHGIFPIMLIQLFITVVLFVVPIAQQASQKPSAEEIFNQAVELQRQNKWMEAVAAWKEFLKLAPKHAGAHANLGTVLSKLNRHEEAIASFNIALQINPGLIPLFYNLGVAQFRAGNFSEAYTSLTRYLASNPNFLSARQMLGLTLVELGRDGEAVAELEAAKTEDAVSLYALGLAYLRMRRTEFSAIAERLIKLPDGEALSHLLIGQAHLRNTENNQALAEFRRAAQLNPELPRLYFSLGQALLRLGQNAEAAQAFEKELTKVPQDFWSLYYLAFLNEAAGKLDEARQRLAIALKSEPRSVEANSLLGKVLLRQSKPSEAIAPLEIATAEAPTDSNLRFQLARAYQLSGRRQDAAREFAEAQRLKNQTIEKERRGAEKP